MNQVNYMRILEEEEVKKMNGKIIKWFSEKINDKNIGSYIYNILLQIRQLIENQGL